MKKNFLHWAMLLTAGLGLALASCSDKEDEGPAGTPVFPKAVEAEILPGESYTLVFETNMKWEASIPASASQTFYIEDGEHKVLTQYGEAGKAEVTIGTYEIENFDETPSCEVSLTIGGETRIAATLTITQQERTLTLHTSQMEDGDFLYNAEEGLSYAYNAENAESIDLVWPAARSGYMYPIMIDANFAWRLAEKSEWIADADYRGESGKVEILLKADPTKYPLDGDQEGKFVLCARSNPDLKYSYKVTIPACRDYFDISGFVAESRFNAQGQFYNASGSSWVDQGMHGYIVSANDPVIYKFVEVTEMSGSYLDAEPSNTSWINIKSTLLDENNVLKSYRYDITVAENATDKARKGVILALPTSVAANINDPYELAGTEINEKYQKYIVTTLNQAAETSGDFVEFYEDLGAEMAQYYTLSELPKNEFPYEGKWASVPAIYNLTYTTEMAGEMAELKFNVSYDSYEVYGEEGPYAESQLNPRWVDLAAGYNGDNCKCIMIAGAYDKMSDSFVWTYDKPVNPEAYFVFKNGSEIVGIIQFRFEEKQQGGGSEISLVGDPAGVTLVQLVSKDADYDNDFGSMGVPQYKLTFTGPEAFKVDLNLPEYDETATYFQNEDLISIYKMGSFYTLMHDFQEAGKTKIAFKNSSWANLVYLVIEYKPE